ncbi:O-antigen ligase [Hydrogenophaga sp.]|uniref:O-antigen ligase family protein n=1 Tax=Hydrogenophaga sp. TaxID=1904254 RepID=UPI002730785E|nr:O-antigen ligase family protein [Hydrogenophaga sp.]MDP1687216.1 O-antigen ligase family protein [Hydrogenophaga sp.]
MITSSLPTSSWRRVLHHVCGWSAVALVFAAPVSRSLFLAASLLYVVSWVGLGQFRLRFSIAQAVPVWAPLVLLASIVAIWAVFSSAPTGDIVNNLKVYSKLLLVLMLAVTFADTHWRNRAWTAFTVSMLVVLASTYANVFVNLPWSRTQNQGIGVDHSVFVEYVSQSVMTAIFMALALHKFTNNTNPKWRVAWALAAAAALGSVLFLLKGRSGLVAMAVVIATFLLLHTPRSIRWRTAFGVALLGAALVASSPLMRERLKAGYQEIATYQSFQESSLGLRMDMWKLAFNRMLEHPIVGTGSGSYHGIAAQHFGYCDFTCTHPHNQYLFFGMEYGLIGLGAFLWLLWRLLGMARRSTAPERDMLFALVAVLAVDSLFNVPLWYRAQSYFFYAMLGLLVASNLPSACQTAATRLRPCKPEA